MKNPRFIELSAEVRYWEDATVNGQADVKGEIPLRKGELWVPVIDLVTGQIQNWPSGVEASIHYKVCDAGEYWLLDEYSMRIAKWKGYYVPDEILCVGGSGHGDYIIFNVDAQGAILKWRRPSIDTEQWQLV